MLHKINRYKILKNNKRKNGIFEIVDIRFEDRFEIMNWRNDQIYHLRQNKPLTIESQEEYFRNVILKEFDDELPKQILFSFLKNDELIGYGGLVHINWEDKNAEISFVMRTSLEKEYFIENWTEFLKLIEKVAFEELKLHKIYVYAFDLRPNLYKALEFSNYFKDAILLEHCFFNGNYIDVVIYSKFL